MRYYNVIYYVLRILSPLVYTISHSLHSNRRKTENRLGFLFFVDVHLSQCEVEAAAITGCAEQSSLVSLDVMLLLHLSSVDDTKMSISPAVVTFLGIGKGIPGM